MRVLPTRYLGIFLGGPKAVQHHWETKVAGSVTRRIEDPMRVGLPNTGYGRATVQKTLVISKVVFQATNQAPPNITPILDQWQRQMCCRTCTGQPEPATNERRGGSAVAGHPP